MSVTFVAPQNKSYTSTTRWYNAQLINSVQKVFEDDFSASLSLIKIPGPLFVAPETGLNDNLNGTERRVTFDMLCDGQKQQLEVVQSLAKWKRWQLKEYQVPIGNGIFVDMRAIRRDDDMDNTHSIYVDQWDWEATLEAKDRNVDTLKLYASKIYESVKRVMALNNPPNFTFDHPLHFVHAKDLYNRWPELTPQQREYNIVKEHRAVFIIGIGGPLNEKGDIHGGRSSSYDSWISQTTDMPEGYHGLNGDLVIWSDVLEAPIEVSSMGIRVNAQDLKKQMALKGDETASENTPYFQAILNNELPLSIGGGIGKSRITMLALRKAHIAEVQCSYWTPEHRAECVKHGIDIL